VLDENGAVVVGAALYLRSAERSTGGTLRNTDSEGTAGYASEKPGDYVVRVESLRHHTQELPVAIEAGKETTVEVRLAALKLAGSIEGSVRSDTGTYVPKVRVVLTSLGGSSTVHVVEPEWKSGEQGKHARFSYPDLPEGRYKVSLVKDDFYDWSPLEVEAAVPSAGIEFVAHDDVNASDLAFRLVDASTSVAIKKGHLWFQIAQGNPRRAEVVSDATAIERVPAAARLEWRIDVEGFQPAFGDLSAFGEASQEGERPRRAAEVLLEPGWGDRFRVRNEADSKPIPGVTVLADGVEVAETDADGVVVLLLAKPPEKLEFRNLGWITRDTFDSTALSRVGYRFTTTVDLAKAGEK
jgi:hypothetical protein